MFRLILSFMFIGVTMSSVYASDCVPPGVEPQKCNADCQLPSCACEDGEPDIPLNERPQVFFHAFQTYFFFSHVFWNIKSYTTSKNVFLDCIPYIWWCFYCSCGGKILPKFIQWNLHKSRWMSNTCNSFCFC